MGIGKIDLHEAEAIANKVRQHIFPVMDRVEVALLVKKAGLLEEEVIAVRLYTGPMFNLYNAALRGFPAALLELLGGNKYETTIFAIISGLIQLSKVTPIPVSRRLYRGLGGMKLPA